MENMSATGTTTTTPNKTTKQPRPFVLALLLTGVLYFAVKPTQPTNSRIFASREETTTKMAIPATKAVLQHVSVESGLPMSALDVVETKQLTWQDRCLGLGEEDGFCSKASVPGWRVTVASGSQRWFYRTDASGSVVIPENDTVLPRQKMGQTAIAQNFSIGNW